MKKIILSSVYDTLLPASIIAVLVISVVLNLHPAVQCITILIALIIVEATGKNEGFRKSLVLTATAFSWAVILSKTEPQTNPWGTTGWVISCGLLILATVAVIVEKKKKTFDFMIQEILEWTLFIGAISGIYVFFLTQHVWVVLAMSTVILLSYDQGEVDYKKISILFLSIGAISTIIQFLNPIGNFFARIGEWGTDTEILPGMSFWIILLISIISVVLILVLDKEAKKLQKKRKAKKEQQKWDEERRIQSEKRRKEDEERKVEDEKRKIELSAKLEKLSTQESISWDDFNPISFFKFKVPENVLRNVDFASVVKFSDVKKQIGFDPHELSRALSAAGTVLVGFNDEAIKEVVKNLGTLGRLNGYKGYDTLYHYINDANNHGTYNQYRLIKKLVHLPEPKEEENN